MHNDLRLIESQPNAAFQKHYPNKTNTQYFGKRQSKLPQNATTNILHYFHDFLILAYLHHVHCYLQHVN